MALLNEAFETLGDPAKRSTYDISRRERASSAQPAAATNPGPASDGEPFVSPNGPPFGKSRPFCIPCGHCGTETFATVPGSIPCAGFGSVYLVPQSFFETFTSYEEARIGFAASRYEKALYIAFGYVANPWLNYSCSWGATDVARVRTAPRCFDGWRVRDFWPPTTGSSSSVAAW